MLDAIGRSCALLDGGLRAWPGPREPGPPSHPSGPTASAVRPWPSERLVEAAGVAEALRAGEVVLDARVAERYRGETEPIDPIAGHIPGARSAPFPDVLRADGTFRSAEELRELFRILGVHDDTAPI